MRPLYVAYEALNRQAFAIHLPVYEAIDLPEAELPWFDIIVLDSLIDASAGMAVELRLMTPAQEKRTTFITQQPVQEAAAVSEVLITFLLSLDPPFWPSALHKTLLWNQPKGQRSLIGFRRLMITD